MIIQCLMNASGWIYIVFIIWNLNDLMIIALFYFTTKIKWISILRFMWSISTEKKQKKRFFKNDLDWKYSIDLAIKCICSNLFK